LLGHFKKLEGSGRGNCERSFKILLPRKKEGRRLKESKRAFLSFSGEMPVSRKESFGRKKRSRGGDPLAKRNCRKEPTCGRTLRGSTYKGGFDPLVRCEGGVRKKGVQLGGRSLGEVLVFGPPTQSGRRVGSQWRT